MATLTRNGCDATECYSCCKELDLSVKRFAFHKQWVRKDSVHVSIERCCPECADGYESLMDAIIADRKFTCIGVAPSIGYYSKYHNEYCRTLIGARCVCGKVAYIKKQHINEWDFNRGKDQNDFCISCGINNRMLGKLQSYQKLIANSLKELRREIKTQNQFIGA